MARYDAFLSYSRRDAAAAEAVQRGLESLLRPFFRLRGLRVYRDETNLPPGSDLWASLEDAIIDSDWLVLLASPESSRSDPIKFELRTWFARKPAGRLIVVVVNGVVAFDEATGRVDWERTDALPRWIHGRASKNPVSSELMEWERALFVDLTSIPGLGRAPNRTLEPVVAAVKGTSAEVARRRFWFEQIAGTLTALALVAVPVFYLLRLTQAEAEEQAVIEGDIEKNLRARDEATGDRAAEQEAKRIADLERVTEEQVERKVLDEANVLEVELELSEADLEIEEAYRGIFLGDQRRELGDRVGAIEAYLGAREALLEHGLSDFPIVVRWMESSPEQALRIKSEYSLATLAGGRIASLGPGRLVDVATGHVLVWAQRPGSGIYDSALGGFRSRTQDGDIMLHDVVTGASVTLTSLPSGEGTEVHGVGFFESKDRFVMTGTDEAGGFMEVRTFDGRVVSRFAGQPTRSFVLAVLEDRRVLLSHDTPLDETDESFGSSLPNLTLLDLNTGTPIWSHSYRGEPLDDRTIFVRRPASIVDLATGETVTALQEPRGEGKALVTGGATEPPLLVDGGRFILIASGEGELALLDTSSGRHLGQVPIGFEDGWKFLAAAPGPGGAGTPDSVLLLARYPEYMQVEEYDWALQPTGRVRNKMPNDRIYVLSFVDARSRLEASAGEAYEEDSGELDPDLARWAESELRKLRSLRLNREAYDRIAEPLQARLEQARAAGDPQGSIGLARLALTLNSSTGRKAAHELFEEAQAIGLDGDLSVYVELCLSALELPAPNTRFVTGEWKR